MSKVWVLVADNYRVRLFSVPSRNNLFEFDDLFHPEARQRSTALDHDRPGRTFDSIGHHRHAIQPRLTPQERETLKFVKEIGQLLESQVDSFTSLHLIAPSKLLGRLRKQLPKAVRAKVTHEIAKDVVDETKSALQTRVRIV